MTPYVALQPLPNSVSCPEYVFLILLVELAETAQTTFRCPLSLHVGQSEAQTSDLKADDSDQACLNDFYLLR